MQTPGLGSIKSSEQRNRASYSYLKSWESAHILEISIMKTCIIVRLGEGLKNEGNRPPPVRMDIRPTTPPTHSPQQLAVLRAKYSFLFSHRLSQNLVISRPRCMPRDDMKTTAIWINGRMWKMQIANEMQRLWHEDVPPDCPFQLKIY